MFLDAAGNAAYSTKVLEHGIQLRSAVQDPDGNPVHHDRCPEQRGRDLEGRPG